MGMRGLLISYRDEMAGNAAPQPAPQPVMAPAAPATSVMAAAPAPDPAPATVAPAALPNFGGAAGTVSLASECNKVNLMTSSGTGLMTVADMTDPNVALTQQMCLARTFAISTGEDMASRVQGFTAEQISQQCAGFGPAMQNYVAELAVKPRDAVMSDVAGFIQTAGMAPAQLEATAKICLSVGYKSDNMNVAIGSALLLTGLGDKPYAELIGHHLSQGFGVPKQVQQALPWYQQSLDALSAGQPAVFAPGQAGRPELIRKAAYAAAGQADNSPAVMPSFAIAAPAAAPAAVPAVAPMPAAAPAAVPAAAPAAAPTEAATAVPASADAGTGTKSSVDDLPLLARLPFLVFK